VPSLAKRPCSYIGCSKLVDSGRCPDHQQQIQKLRGKTAERGYGKTHRNLRVLCFIRDQWKCVDCGWEPELVVVFRDAQMSAPTTPQILEDLRLAYAQGKRHLHADHEIPIEERPDLQSDLDNYRTRCDHCHNAKTAREDGGYGN
jgi:5-methylcytosine-specific restriction protein A